MNNETTALVKRLRKQCLWQQTKGTKFDSGYPYNKHLQDCEICIAAKALEDMSKQVADYVKAIDRLGSSETFTRPSMIDKNTFEGGELVARMKYARSERKRIAAMEKNDGLR